MIPPLTLDNPSVHRNAERLERVLEFVKAASKVRRVLRFTHDERL
jgi:hypothetical protein